MFIMGLIILVKLCGCGGLNFIIWCDLVGGGVLFI